MDFPTCSPHGFPVSISWSYAFWYIWCTSYRILYHGLCLLSLLLPSTWNTVHCTCEVFWSKFVLGRFLPYDAMHKCGLCCRALSVCHVHILYSVEMSKGIVKLFLPYSFSAPNCGDCPPPLTRVLNACGVGKNLDSRPISGFGIDDWSSVVNSFDHGMME